MSATLQDSGTRTIQLVSGSSSTQFISPNEFQLTLPSSGFRTGRDEIALKSLTMYYSWANVSAALGNNKLQYMWPGVATPFDVVMADGIWSFADVLAYLQQVMTQNNHYLLDQYGNQIFYISLLLNSVLYCLSLTCTQLPASLPAGWSNPGAVNLAATASQTPQLIVPAGSAVFTGFAAGTYPPALQTAIYHRNSGIPQITQVTSLNITSSLVDNRGFSLIPGVLTSFTLPNGTIPGSLVQYQPFSLDWVPVQAQIQPTQILVSVTDQLGRPIVIRDSQGVVITLNIRRRAM